MSEPTEVQTQPDLPQRLREIAAVPEYSFEAVFEAADEIELLRHQHKNLGQICVDQVLRAERAEETLRKVVALIAEADRFGRSPSRFVNAIRDVINEGRP